MEHLTEGSIAPGFTLATAEGGSLDLYKELESRRVVLAFYKVSCPTCQLTLPFLQRLFASFGEERTVIWGVSQDDRPSTAQFVARYGLQFPNLIDEHPYPVSSAYGLEFVPALYFVDSDRSVRIADCGFSKTTLNEIRDRMAIDTAVTAAALFSTDDRLPETQPG